MAGHDVILTRETTTGFDEIAAAFALSSLLKLQPNQAKAVAAGGKRRRVARGISPARAAQLTETIRALGIEVTITPPIAAPRTPRLALEDEADFRSEDTQDGPADEPLTLAPIETRPPQPPADDVDESPVPRSPEARSVGAIAARAG